MQEMDGRSNAPVYSQPSSPKSEAEPLNPASPERTPTPSMPNAVKERYLSLDAYRGLIMILLVSGGLGFSDLAPDVLAAHPIYRAIANQLEHRPWGGADFEDMIMPAFLFMVGVAMPFALARRKEQGATPRDAFKHVLVRSLRLILISEIWVSIIENRPHLSVHNVLFVVGITYFACYLLMRLEFWKQATVAASLLVLHSAIYLLFPGPNGAFAQVTNAGARLDRWLMLARFNYPWQCVTINLVSEVPSVLFGIWVGNLLRSGKDRSQQMKILTLGMLAAFVLGLAFSPLVPINKWLWTSTYTLYTTGWSIFGLLVFYLLVEVLGLRRPMFPLMVVGRNSLFVYCLAVVGASISEDVKIFTGGFAPIGALAPVAQSCAVLLVTWYLAYWLYKRKIFLTA